MKALVTGSEGFVGSHLIKELSSKGYEIIATYKDRQPIYLPPKAQAFRLDILDLNSILLLFDRQQPNLVFHLAGLSSVKASIEDPDVAMRLNVEGTKNIIEAAEEMDKSPALVLAGSSEEYGEPEFLPVPEEHPLKPINPYGKSKMQAESLGRESAKRGFRVILLRSFNHIGPGQSENFAVSSFAKQIAEIEKGKRKFLETGNLETKRDFTDVRDIARAYLLAAEKCDSGDPYNVCSGSAYSMKAILDSLISMSSTKIEVRQAKERIREDDIPVMAGDSRKFFRKTGWKPMIDMDTSLRDILDFWRKNK